jgi:hypothetical protein
MIEMKDCCRYYARQDFDCGLAVSLKGTGHTSGTWECPDCECIFKIVLAGATSLSFVDKQGVTLLINRQPPKGTTYASTVKP